MASVEDAAFGGLLRRMRLAAGLTHEALAERAAVSARTISDLERGVARAPRRETLAQLAAGLALSPDERAILEAAALGQSAAAAAPRHNLPWQPTSFVGREPEVRELAGLLRRPEPRLVTVTGPGGTGKTRLALHVAAALADEVADGTFFVPLAPVADADLIGPAIAAALGLGKVGGQRLDAVVREYLRPRRVLLLLDNFEHLLGGAPRLAELLAACRGVKALVTSRAALRLAAEQELPLGPLPVPRLRPLPGLDELARCASVALFAERAARVRPDFRLEAENAAAVAATCVRLDGLPLAVELAAARVKLLSPEALLEQLGRPGEASLRLLTAGPRDAPARQRTLRATIAWSYDLLGPAESRLFRRLSVFLGGCDLRAIEAVCRDGEPAAGRPGPPPLPDELVSLVEHSLVQRQDETGAEPRFAMLETVREFAAEQAEASGEAAALRARHARYFLDLIEATGPMLLGTARDRARMDAEQENIRAALRWFVAGG